MGGGAVVTKSKRRVEIRVRARCVKCEENGNTLSQKLILKHMMMQHLQVSWTCTVCTLLPVCTQSSIVIDSIFAWLILGYIAPKRGTLQVVTTSALTRPFQQSLRWSPWHLSQTSSRWSFDFLFKFTSDWCCKTEPLTVWATVNVFFCHVCIHSVTILTLSQLFLNDTCTNPMRDTYVNKQTVKMYWFISKVQTVRGHWLQQFSSRLYLPSALCISYHMRTNSSSTTKKNR